MLHKLYINAATMFVLLYIGITIHCIRSNWEKMLAKNWQILPQLDAHQQVQQWRNAAVLPSPSHRKQANHI